jgi:N-acetyl-anhydromuramyl-L-alanine amidase AmpD
LCEVSPQLIAVPAFFALDTQTDPTQPNDWNRIKNAGGWVGLIVADAGFETAPTARFDLHNAPTTQKTYGYVFTGSGSVPENTAMSHVQSWNAHYGASYVKGLILANAQLL